MAGLVVDPEKGLGPLLAAHLPELALVQRVDFGAMMAVVIDALTFFTSASLIATMRVPSLAREPDLESGLRQLVSEFLEGLRIILRNRTVSGIVLTLAVTIWG